MKKQFTLQSRLFDTIKDNYNPIQHSFPNDKTKAANELTSM